MKTNAHPHPRNLYVKELLETLGRERCSFNKAHFVDRGIGTLQDGYQNEEQLAQIINYYAKLNTGEGLRNRLAQCNCNFMSLRGESARSMDLSDLHCLQLENEGPSSCVVILATLDNGKTNKFNKIEYGASLRNRNVEICPHGKFLIL